MSLLSPEFSQIRALVDAVQSKFKEARVIGIRAQVRWTGDSRREEAGNVYLLRQCDSPLQMRIALREETEPGAIRVLLTPLNEAELGDDVLLGLAKRRLFPMDSWQITQTLFQAQEIDPRLTQRPWLAEYLLEALPPDGSVTAPGGFLDAETVWPLLLAYYIGLTPKRPDLYALLEWSLDSGNVARLRAMSGEFRQAASEWIADSAGSAALLLLRCALKNDQPDTLPVALAAGVIFHPDVRGKLERAVVRMEERYLDGAVPDENAILRISAAAAAVVRARFSEADTLPLLQRSDALLREVGAESWAYLSDISPDGFDQRMARLGQHISRSLETGNLVSENSLEAARRAVRAHSLADQEPRRMERVDMALRLTEWMKRLRNTPPQPLSSFAMACAYHIEEGSFVDWARSALRDGDPERELSNAFRDLTKAVCATRETQAREFAELLQDWTAAGSVGDGVIPVERILTEIVAPLAARAPLLVIVMDGMSVAVAREMSADITNHEWAALRPEMWTSAIGAGLSAIPSVTEVSRTSLLCGRLCQGTADAERKGFAQTPALLQQCRPGHPPILFHKALLQEGTGANLAPAVREAISSSSKRIVGVVINAVDDHLLKSDQIVTRWRCEDIKPLPALLHEARNAGRLVVLLSDHGHILENGTQAHSGDGGERWRLNHGAPATEEIQIRGSRVVLPESHTLIAPWSESIRYGGKKNGYHGGLTPQEMIVPILALCGSNAYPDGWNEAVSDTPTWWVDPFLKVETRAITREPAGVNYRNPSTLTLELDDVSDTQHNGKRVGESSSKWIEQILDSFSFTPQKTLPSGTAITREEIAKLLRAMDEHGTMPMSTLGRYMNTPPTRLSGLLTAAQRILNVDGFAILTWDSGADTVHLNRRLLIQQFGNE